MDFLPLGDNAYEIQIRLARSVTVCVLINISTFCRALMQGQNQFKSKVERLKVVGAIHQLSHVFKMTALNDFITLKIPARSSDWEFLNASTSGFSFEVSVR